MKNNRSRRQTKAECRGGKKGRNCHFFIHAYTFCQIDFLSSLPEIALSRHCVNLTVTNKGNSTKYRRGGLGGGGGGVLMQVCKHKAEMH